MARTNLSIDRNVFEEFADQVEKRNMTMYAFANESLSVISKVAAEGGDPSSLYSIWKVVNILKEADAITLPSDFVEQLIDELYAADKERLLQHFSELGASIVGLLKIFAEDATSLSALAKEFGFIVPIKRFTLTNGGNGNIRVDVVGAGKSMATTECSTAFLKAVLNGYGYTVSKEDIHPGAIRILSQKRSQAMAEAVSVAPTI